MIELGETLAEAAKRETREETGITIKPGNPEYTFDVIQRDQQGRVLYHYVIVDLRAEYVSGEISSADDAGAAGWFTLSEIKSLDMSIHTLDLLKKIGHELLE
jgi:ADP-ribose pyrophosphatase